MDQQEVNNIAINNANTALGVQNKQKQTFDIKNNPDIVDESGYRHCKINFGVDYSGNVFQFKNDILLTDAEAYAAYRLLAFKMEQLSTTGQPISFSMKVRNLDKKIVCRSFSRVVYIEHDIPELADVTEDEDVG